MLGGSNGVEVLALFAIAAMVAWPALRGRLAGWRGSSDSQEDAPAAKRFEPKVSAAHCEHATPSPPLSAEVAYGDVAEPYAASQANECRAPVADDDGGLALAEAEASGGSAVANGEPIGARNGHRSLGHVGIPLKAAAAQPTPAAVASAAKATQCKILLVDRREKFRTSMLLELARSGHRVYPVENGREAIDVFNRERTDLIMIHRESLCEAGSSFARRVHARAPHVPILVHGGRPGAGDVGALKHGVDITVVANAGDDCGVLGEMIDCSLAATRSIRNVQDDQQVRGKMLADLCFDLRSAIDVVSGYTDILSDEPELGPHAETLERMRVSMTSAAATVQMQSYVDVALDVAENVREERVDLAALSEQVRHLVTRQIGAHPLTLTTSGPIDGCALFTDGEKLLAILSHVITDTVLFTPTGEINIAVRSTVDRTDFVVTDVGPAIRADVAVPPTLSSRLASGASTGGAVESGVGLTIAERLSRLIGATVTGPDGDGGAAQFTISVPSKLMTPSTEAASRLLH